MNHFKRTVRLIPTHKKRKLARDKKVLLEEERLIESREMNKALKRDKKRKELESKKRLHKKGKARARVCVDDGMQQIELESDAELDVDGQELSDLDECSESAREVPRPKPKVDVVYTSSGSTTTRCQALYAIVNILENTNGSTLPESIVAEHSGVALGDERNADFRECLCSNPGITVYDAGDGTLLFKKNAPLSVANKADLHSLFSHQIPRGSVFTCNGLAALGVAEMELKGAYFGIERDLDRMISSGDVLCIGDHCRTGLNVYYPVPTGVAASPCLKSLWNSVEVPDQNDLRNELVKMGLRTKESFELRGERTKANNRAATARTETDKRITPLMVRGVQRPMDGSLEDLFE